MKSNRAQRLFEEVNRWPAADAAICRENGSPTARSTETSANLPDQIVKAPRHGYFGASFAALVALVVSSRAALRVVRKWHIVLGTLSNLTLPANIVLQERLEATQPSHVVLPFSRSRYILWSYQHSWTVSLIV